MNSSQLFKTLFLMAFAALMAGCSATGNPLAGGFVETSKCPPGGCAGLEPDANQLTITNGGKTTMYVAYRLRDIYGDGSGDDDINCEAGEVCIPDGVEIGGDCYASTYPNNRIEVQILQNGIQVQLNNGDIASSRAVAGSILTPRCVNGRYGFSINGGRMPAGNHYQVKVDIIGIDANGAEFRNPGGGRFNVQISR